MKTSIFRIAFLIVPILLLWSLVTAKDANETINSFGNNYSSIEWGHIRDSVKCFSENGTWVYDQNATVFDNSMNWNDNWARVNPCIFYGGRSVCRHALQSNASSYVWQSNPKCKPIHPFNLHKFCNLKHRNIMIVGDSMNELLFGVIRNTILYHYPHSYTSSHSATEMCNNDHFEAPFTIKCPVHHSNGTHGGKMTDGFTITGIRNDYLSNKNTTVTNSKNEDFEHKWFDKIGSHNISVLLLNRGAHYVEDDVLLREVNATLCLVKDRYPNVSIIWRNTPHGHAFPVQNFFKPPLTIPMDLKDLDYYNYNSFDRQNKLVESMLLADFPEIVYWDVYTPTVLRIDSHPDPLHYCSVGPMITWVTLLYNILALFK